MCSIYNTAFADSSQIDSHFLVTVMPRNEDDGLEEQKKEFSEPIKKK